MVASSLFPIVGIGASAGGIQALEVLLRGAPTDAGLAYVVVTHLSTDRVSALPDILSRFTSMPVHAVETAVTVVPDNVYALTAGTVLTLRKRRLNVTHLPKGKREPKPVDVFLSSLALDVGEYAAAIILSGGDGDGTIGAKAVKERSGLTLAQIGGGSQPQNPEMPNSAIAAGVVDFAIPVEEMGARLREFAQGLAAGAMAGSPGDRRPEEDIIEADLQKIAEVLKAAVGRDFSGYKPRTFMRRVQRRMQISQSLSLEQYIERLKADAEEAKGLFADLMINVTAFFRDVDAFEALERLVVPKLFEGRGPDDTVRVWVPGCATGEEAYSIGILLREQMLARGEAPRVQIFATDIDEAALAVARTARYPEALLDVVTPERRRRHFQRDGGSYVLNKDVRELCIFSPHSVLSDPPFSRIDLVSCRNLLIYFAAEAQARVLPTFHYALRPSGYLFLGSSENVSHHRDFFTPLDKQQRIFRCRMDVAASSPLPTGYGLTAATAPGDTRPGRGVDATRTSLRQLAEAAILERFAPAHVLVDRDGEILHFSARTGRYLEASVGAPTRQLLAMARKGLRLDLRSALREAVQSEQPSIRQNIRVDGDNGESLIATLTVEPLATSERGPCFLVIFNETGPAPVWDDVEPATRPQRAAAQIEQELNEVRDRLQGLVEEYETALEELKSANEELVSVNEELQSTNEEHEASKEELQSVNEELHTVNADLIVKVDALDRANDDLQNLFESTRIALIFLDQELVIRSYTPAVSAIFNIKPSDKGRPLTDLASSIPLPTLKEDVENVLAGEQLIERQILREREKQHFLIRMAPYRGRDRKVEGVVVTFVDVTTLSKAEAQQRILHMELNHRVKNMLAVVIGMARQMERASGSDRIDSTAFVNRLLAMSRAFELLSRESWTDVSIGELIQQEFHQIVSDRVTIDGPEVRLLPKQALSVGMVVHELVTNAVKFGGLSRPGGTVAVTWFETPSNGGGDLTLRWSETTDGPIVMPSKYGFGLKIIEREGAYNLVGHSKIDFREHGLQVSLTFPTTGEIFRG
jgi:two-component system CheB/CheR fusion protein